MQPGVVGTTLDTLDVSRSEFYLHSLKTDSATILKMAPAPEVVGTMTHVHKTMSDPNLFEGLNKGKTQNPN